MNRILVLPTGNAGSFTFILVVVWYVGMAQNNGAAYLLFFLLLAVLLVSAPKTFLNLTAINVTAESPKPVFGGQEVSLPVELMNFSGHPRCAVSVGLPGKGKAPEHIDEIPAGKAARAVIRFPAAQRGAHEVYAVLIESAYPLGFFRARRKLVVRQHYVVYPKPAGDPNLPHSVGHNGSAAENVQPEEGDDFAGVRPYLPGESQRHIDWKAVARGHPLMSKQFARDEGGALHLDFDAISEPELEGRLSQLALWIIRAEQGRLPYSLRLPLIEIPASIGEAHYHQCLRALACYS